MKPLIFLCKPLFSSSSVKEMRNVKGVVRWHVACFSDIFVSRRLICCHVTAPKLTNTREPERKVKLVVQGLFERGTKLQPPTPPKITTPSIHIYNKSAEYFGSRHFRLFVCFIFRTISEDFGSNRKLGVSNCSCVKTINLGYHSAVNGGRSRHWYIFCRYLKKTWQFGYRRGFSSKEVLSKHKDMSDLHKKNLEER